MNNKWFVMKLGLIFKSQKNYKKVFLILYKKNSF